MNSGYETPVPSDYDDLPQLKGRATVEMVVKKAEGEKFDIEGQLYNEAKMKMIIDGYAAPVTSGNFIDLVQKGRFKCTCFIACHLSFTSSNLWLLLQDSTITWIFKDLTAS